jgi:nucleoside-triphosphatase THEP1
MVSLEFYWNSVLNPHTFADEIKRHPEVETLLVTRDNRTEVMQKVLSRLTEG